METILSANSFCPLFKTPIFQPRSTPGLKPISCALKKQISRSIKQSFHDPSSWFSHVNLGIAALAISLALTFSCPILANSALASEFDVLSDGPPAEPYVVDDASVLSRVTKSDLRRLLSGLESRKGYHINIVTVRKLTSKADAFEYADQVLERWYPLWSKATAKA